ncbi:2,4-dienoyl-CoA reductase-like NADH-dependent reductase (Old Yellow Enzyme family), partial [Glycomyces algeriensis]|nr:2,4-dienoyl-CoA reductase-like NADH-dependent reductase (Old Yellow Enzyme family) [Glycomyces algeriensis]
AVGRSLIADPEWPSRITKGEKTNPFSAELLGALH